METEKKIDWRNIGIIAATVVLTLAVVSGAFWFGLSQSRAVTNTSNVPANTNTPAAVPGKDLKIKGNRNSMIYHLPGCPNYNDIAENHIAWFKTHEEAQQAGFRIARNC